VKSSICSHVKPPNSHSSQTNPQPAELCPPCLSIYRACPSEDCMRPDPPSLSTFSVHPLHLPSLSTLSCLFRLYILLLYLPLHHTLSNMANDTSSAHQQIGFTTHQGDDEGYQESSCSLVTLPPEIIEGKLENGRCFATYGNHEYLLPMDKKELNRLDLNHEKYYLLYNGKRFLSPITNPKNILDLGCGTGM
jgi:hypothetical protein